jgi:hypothetical protein
MLGSAPDPKGLENGFPAIRDVSALHAAASPPKKLIAPIRDSNCNRSTPLRFRIDAPTRNATS